MEDSMTAVDPGTGLPPDDDRDEVARMIGSIGDAWWVLLALGVLSVIVGILAVAWPGATILVVAFLFAIWLIVSGIFQLARAFAKDLSGGSRTLLIISGILSVILGLIAIRGALDAWTILAIFVGIGFLFRGFVQLLLGLQEKGRPGRGWDIFGGIILIIGGVVVLVWPGISLVTLAIVLGIWLIVIGLFEIIASFRVRSVAKDADKAADAVRNA
jgi:uncharacterized membrane protein HdeD (DUF308 family)